LQWIKVYEPYQPQYDFLSRTSDGGYVVGINYIYDPGFQLPPLYAYFIVKTNPTGDIQWNMTGTRIHTPPNFVLTDVVQTSDGGYILAGTGNNESDNYIIGNSCLMKLSGNGVPEWNRTYPASLGFLGWPLYVEQTADGGYILVGSYSTGNNPQGYDTYDFALLKTNSTGGPQWNITYAGGQVFFVHQTEDGGYILAGRDDYGRVILLKTNSTGGALWNRTYSTASTNDGCISAIATSDGGYAMANVVGLNLVLYRIAGNGTLLWQETYGGNWRGWSFDYGPDFDIQQTSDGGYIIVGSTYYSYNPLLLKVDGGGAVQWMKSDFAGNLRDSVAFSVVQSSDGGYVFAGVWGVSSFIAKVGASPVLATSLPFASLVIATELESVAIVVLVERNARW
jgi:hypothetical protein